MSKKCQLKDEELDEIFDAEKMIMAAQKKREKAGCYICGKPIIKGQQTCNEHLVAGFLDQLNYNLIELGQVLSSGFLDMENAIDELRNTMEKNKKVETDGKEE